MSVAAALAIGGGVAAAASSAPSPSTSPSPSASGSAAPERPARTPQLAGTVVSASDGTIVITDRDGFQRTIHTSSATKYEDGLTATPAAGTKIFATGTVDADKTSLLATEIRKAPDRPEGRGPGGHRGWPGGPGGRGPGKPDASGTPSPGTPSPGTPSPTSPSPTSPAPSASPTS